MTALRYNSGKAQLSYFRRSFSKALRCVARIMEFGACKYADDNWRQGGKPDSEYLDSLDRHLDAWLEGEQHDKDSGCHHLGHAIWNLCALFELNYGDTPAIDEEVFRQQCDYWRKKKEEKKSPSIHEWDLTNFKPPVGALYIGEEKVADVIEFNVELDGDTVADVAKQHNYRRVKGTAITFTWKDVKPLESFKKLKQKLVTHRRRPQRAVDLTDEEHETLWRRMVKQLQAAALNRRKELRPEDLL